MGAASRSYFFNTTTEQTSWDPPEAGVKVRYDMEQ
jgi:hypothetical protein